MGINAVINFLRPYRRRLIIGPAFKFTEAVLELAVPLLIAQMINRGVRAGDWPVIYYYGFLSLLLAVLGWISALICQYNAAIASQSYGTDLRDHLLEHILKLPTATVESLGSSTLSVRLTSDVMTLQEAVAMLIRLVVRAPFLAIGSLVMAFYLSWRLALVFLVALLFFVCLLYVVMSRMLPGYRQVQRQTDGLIGQLLDFLNAIQVVRALTNEEMMQTQFELKSEDIARAQKRISRLSSLFNPLTALILNGATVCILYLSGAELRSSRIEIGDLVAFVNYLSMMLLALSVVANLVILYTKAYSSALRIAEVLALPEEVDHSILQQNNGAPSLEPVSKAMSAKRMDMTTSENAVTFSAVDFSYHSEAGSYITDMNWQLPRRQHLGIIGATGSGKSTVANLIQRLYNIQAGEISLYGRTLSSFSEEDLLHTVHVVPQEAILFKGSLRENLTCGLSKVEDDQIWRALEIAQAAEFVSELTEKLDSPVQRGGKNFSGGQRQRLCLARGIIRQPRLLILDDATSALDYATDACLWQALTSLLKSDNSLIEQLIIISQRVHTVRRCDRIMVLDQGRVEGWGTHRELLANPIYRDIVASQAEVER